MRDTPYVRGVCERCLTRLLIGRTCGVQNALTDVSLSKRTQIWCVRNKIRLYRLVYSNGETWAFPLDRDTWTTEDPVVAEHFCDRRERPHFRIVNVDVLDRVPMPDEPEF